MKIRIKKLHPDAIIPSYQTSLAAGFDLHAIHDELIRPGERKLIRTGLACAIEEGYEVQIRPRSGLALKHGITVLNAPGTIDADYRGEWMVVLINHGNEPFTISKGERIAQGVIQKVVRAQFEEVDALDETERGANGFGSTGR
ncbi:MAG: dUTP diphosphatase [Campylobacterales bacterium]